MPLNKISSHQNGFTLIELLVAISIIAILAVISFSVYSNAQKNARNSRRTQDIEAIAKALESNKTISGYVNVASSQFAGGKMLVL